MKKTIIAATISTLMLSGAVPAMAAGVSLDVGAGADVGVDAGDVGVGVNAGANVNAATNGILNNSNGALAATVASSSDVDLSAVVDESNVNIVLLSSLEADVAAQVSGAAEAVDANSLTNLQANVDANAAIKAKLEAQGFATTDVIALQTNVDGSVVVVVDDVA
jgi:hypothetical protein